MERTWRWLLMAGGVWMLIQPLTAVALLVVGPPVTAIFVPVAAFGATLGYAILASKTWARRLFPFWAVAHVVSMLIVMPALGETVAFSIAVVALLSGALYGLFRLLAREVRPEVV